MKHKLYQNRFAQEGSQIPKEQIQNTGPMQPQNAMKERVQPQSFQEPQTQMMQQQMPSQNPREEQPKGKISPNALPRPTLTSQENTTYQKYVCSRKEPQIIPAYKQFFAKDEGNPNPRLLRCSLTKIGNEPAFINQSQVPFGIVVQPLADLISEEEAVPMIQYENGPIRCSRCKAYMNPYFQFVQNGNIGICNICQMNNKIAPEYFSSTDQFGNRQDKYERSELHLAAYEFLAPSIYNNKEIGNNYLLFCLEFTPQNLLNGSINQVLSSLDILLDNLVCPEKTEICLMTFTHQMAFYNIPEDLSKEPLMIVINELDEPCPILPRSQLFINALTGKERLHYIIQKLQQLSQTLLEQKQKFQQSCLLSVLSTSLHLFENLPGKILFFTSTLPTAGIQLKRKEDNALKDTDKEKQMYALDNAQIVSKLARECLEARVAVDIFNFSSESIQLVTLGYIVNLTGGSLYHYSKYNSILDGEKLHYDLSRNLTRYSGVDSVMTVRSSNGLQLKEYYTGLGKVLCRDLEMSAIDADKTVTLFFKQDEIIHEQEAYIQYAILYTNPFGQRVIRVINYCLSVVNTIALFFKSVDQDCVIALLMRQFIHQISQIPIKTIYENIFNSIISILSYYRTHVGQGTPAGQLLFPGAIPHLFVYLLSLQKQIALRSGMDVRLDDRFYEIYYYSTCSIYNMVTRLYPKVYPLHTLNNEEEEENNEQQQEIMPPNIPLSSEFFEQNGIYLIDNAETIYLAIFSEANSEQVNELLGISLELIDASTQLPQLDTQFNIREKQKCFVSESQNYYLKVEYLIIQMLIRDINWEIIFTNILIEDQSRLSKSYFDYLKQLHAEVMHKVH